MGKIGSMGMKHVHSLSLAKSKSGLRIGLEVSKPVFETRVLLYGGVSSRHSFKFPNGDMKGAPMDIP